MSHTCQYAFFKAISDNNMDPILKQNIIRECIDMPEYFDINYNESEALMHATHFCDYRMVKLLIENGINVCAQNNLAIINACKVTVNIKMIKLLIENGADVSAQNNEAIVTACQCVYNVDIIKILVEHGADPFARNNTLICSAKCVDIVKFLMELGADPFVNNNELFYNACKSKNINLVEFLIKIGTDCTQPDNKPICSLFIGQKPMELKKLLLDNGADPNSKDESGEYLLERAVLNISVEDCALLLEYGADINLCWKEIDELINYDSSYYFKDPEGMQDIIALFKEHGVDIPY